MPKPPFRDFMVSAKLAKREEPKMLIRREEPKVEIPLVEDERSIRTHMEKPGRSSTKKFFYGLVLLLVFSFGFMKVSALFSSALVKITPVREKVSINDSFIASLNNNKEGEGVSFKVMKVEESESLSINAQKSEKVSNKAYGEIYIYNNYSSSAQTLIAGTRFETVNGKIYKINKAVTVPGKKIVNGKMTPGSLLVTVYASAPGEEYNIGLSDFTLPGLKGGSRYTEVYARSKGLIKGGYVGEMKIVSKEEVSQAKIKLAKSLNEKLLAKAKTQVPEGYILYEDAIFAELSDNSSELGTKSEGNKVTLTMKGILSCAIFPEKELAQMIAKKKITNLQNDDVHSDSLKDLIFKVVGKSGVNLKDNKVFSFKLEGDAEIVWNLDVKDFKQNLAGLSKYKYQEIFSKYPMVEKAETIFSPSWSSVFPTDLEKISIEIIENKN